MTEAEIKALIASEVEKILAIQNEEEPDYEVLETVMFDHPSDWGRRIILRGNEVVLQRTVNKGVTWKDEDLGNYKIMLSTTTTKTKSMNTLGKIIYNGLYFAEKVMTKATYTETEELKISPEIQEVINSGQLLRKTTTFQKNNIVKKTMSNLDTIGETVPQSSILETITFLGGLSMSGLDAGQVYLDENNFMKIA